MPRSDKERITTFSGFKGPNYTMVPDELFDQLMVDLSGAELKVLLYIIRRTFGFKRDSDNISLSQMLNGIQRRDGRVLDRGVGLSKKTLLQALNRLEERHIILTQRRQSAERGNEPTAYRLNVLESPHAEKPTPPLGEKLPQGVGEETPPSPWGKNSPKQETDKQETDRYNSIYRNAFTSSKDSEERSFVTNGDPSLSGTDRTALSIPAGSAPRDGMEAIGVTLARRQEPRVSNDDEARSLCVSYLEDFARELGDRSPLRHSVSRALNLYRRSGRSRDEFIAAMYLARSRTKEATKVRNRMAYWFSCLEDVLDVKEAS